MYFRPVMCMHCDEPPCRDVCAPEAIYKRDDGIVMIDMEKCDGCRACVAACPYGAVTYDPDAGTVRKCNLCYERLDDGFEPFCVLCCGLGAIYCGDISDPDSEVSRLIESRGGYNLKPEEGTGPGVYYLPPGPARRPF